MLQRRREIKYSQFRFSDTKVEYTLRQKLNRILPQCAWRKENSSFSGSALKVIQFCHQQLAVLYCSCQQLPKGKKPKDEPKCHVFFFLHSNKKTSRNLWDKTVILDREKRVSENLLTLAGVQV